LKKKLYLANPLGFSKQANNLLFDFIEIFNELNIEVYEPFSRTGHLFENGDNWAYSIAEKNLKDLKKSDCIFAIVNGNPPDEGVMIELGYAMALKKEIFLFRDDFRNCSDSDQYPLNLMIFAGLSKKEWSRNYLESLEDIKSEKKNFLKWVKTN
tara:strand:- start:5 stop:466 length:462 start_codon:yes stop_codon:yes gene_type:complete